MLNISVKSKLQYPPPLSQAPWAFDTFALTTYWGGGNLIIRVFQGVRNLNRSLDFMWNLWELCIWQAIMADMVFVEKIVPLWPIGYEERA